MLLVNTGYMGFGVIHVMKVFGCHRIDWVFGCHRIDWVLGFATGYKRLANYGPLHQAAVRTV